MKILKGVVLLIGLVILSSCEKAPEPRVVESCSETQPKLVAYYAEEGDQVIKVQEEKFYEDGTREYVGSFDPEGNRHGEWRYFYESGQLWSLGSYIHGLKDGRKEVYWPDGTLRYQGQFTDDKKSGTWTFYNPDGTVLEKMNFDAEKARSQQ